MSSQLTSGVVSFADPFNDDRLVPLSTTPSITLAVSPSSVAEDGTSNLIYTFTRTGVRTNALTVNYTVGGTATIGTDYTGITTAGTTKTVTFAAGSSTATVTVDPTADRPQERDEGVNMSDPTTFTCAANSTANSLTNVVNSVFTDANGALGGNQALGVNSAALVNVTTAGIGGTYLVINDGVAGFQSGNDLLVNITGCTGTLPALGAIAVNNFFI